MIEAELHDGTILEFPDGTPDDIVQSTVKKHLGIGAAPAAPASAAPAPALALPEQPAKQSALADLADLDTGVEKITPPAGPALADTAIGRTVTGALESATRGLRSMLEPRRGNRGPQNIGIPNRPVLPDVATQTAGLFEAPKESYADLEARNPQDARWSAVLASLPERARASLGKTFADSQRLLGTYEASLANLEASLGTDFEKRYPNNPNAQEMRRLRDEIAVLKMVSAQFEGDTKAATPKNETLPQKALGSLAESAFPTVAAIAAGAATRSPALAMLLGGGGGGVMEASSTYAEAIDKGATPQVATRAGILNGILEGVGEAIPLGIALRPGSPLRARVWNVIGAEAGQEVATQVMQDLNNKLSFDPNMRFDEAVDNALVAAMSGAMGGAVYGGVGAALQKAAEQPAKEMVPAPPPLRPVTPALDAALADKPAVRALVQSPYAEPAFAQGAVQGPMTAPSTATGAPAGALPPTGDGTRSAPVVVTAPEHLEQAEQIVNTEPTEAQKEAGNYQKAHVQYQGFDVTIENPKGSTRSGTATDGTAWSVDMPATYGYVKRTEGADGDQVDVYLGGNPSAPRVWIVDQIDPATGKFDEAKVLMGFDSREEALKTYEAGFSDGKGAQRAGAVTEMAVEQFREWVDKGDTKAPLAYKLATVKPQGTKTAPPTPDVSPKVPREKSPAAPKPTTKPAEVTSETARRAEFKLTSGAAAKVIETAQRGRFTVSVAGESYGSFVMDDAGRVSNIKARANWAMGNVTEAANTFAAGQRGETTNVADAPKPPAPPDTKFKPGDIVDARPGRTIPKATVVRSFFKKMNGFDDPVEAVEIETPDGRRLQLLALEVKPWQADADSTSPKPSPKPSPSAADAASVSADDFDALINEVQAERKQPEAPKEEPKAPTKARIIPTRSGIVAQPIDDAGNPVGEEYRAGEKTTAAEETPESAGDYERGQRVEILDGELAGRHGTIVDKAVLVSRALGISSFGRNSEERTVYYRVMSDAGAQAPSLRRESLRPETGDRPDVVPDINVEGVWRLPEDVLRMVPMLRKDAEGKIAAAGRAVKAEKKAEHRAAAQKLNERAAAFQAAFDAWARAHPEAAAKYVEQAAPQPAAAPDTPGQAPDTSAGRVAAAGLTVTKSTTKNGTPAWEVGGNTRAHSDMLKRLGGRWYGPKKVWSFYTGDPTVPIAVALGKQPAAQPAAEPAPAPKTPPRTPKVKANADQQTDPRLPMLREHFAIGNVIRSAYWRDHDRVLAFDEGNDRMGWSVTVQKVEKKGDEWVPVAGERPRVHSTMPSPKDEIVDRVGQAEPTTTAEQPGQNGQEPNANAPLKQAAQHAAEGVKEGFAGLDALFGRKGTLGSGPAFDEQTWAKAKPHFEAAFREFVAAGKSLKEFVRHILDTYNDAVVPYLKRWHADHVAAQQPGANENGGAGTGQQGEKTLGGVPPREDGRAEGGGDVSGSDAGGGRDGTGRDRSPDEAGVSGARGGGGGTAPVRAPAAGAGRAGRGTRRARSRVSGDDAGTAGESGAVAPRAPNVPGANFIITDEVRLGQGGEAEKFRDNLAAIRTLKAIEAENRRATPEEQRTLARYVGWGGLANAFATGGEFKPDWAARGQELASILTADELKAARRSTRNAHYTSETVIGAVWDIVSQLGFKGGLVLEPSVGSGSFLGLIPEELSGATKFIGVEYDSLTARIAQLLYPQSTILHSGFQRVPIADGAFDLNVGNPPFGSESLRFQYKPEINQLSIHNQFFVAGLDSLKPGGVQVMVVSRYLMDAKDSTARKMIAKRARLLGVIRLPDTAFRENARTDVVTDIVILQRMDATEQEKASAAIDAAGRKPEKDRGEEAQRQRLADEAPSWLDTTEVRDPLGGETMTVNRYFAENPDMVIGRLERSGKMQFSTDSQGNKAGGVNVKLQPGQDMQAMLDEAIDRLPADVMRQQPDAIQASVERYAGMADALKIALTGKEPGHVEVDADGNLTQIIERETPEGDYEFASRTLTAQSPWSEQLSLDKDGRWYMLTPEVGADGKPVKVMKGDQATNRNVYTRKTFPTDAAVPDTMRLGQSAYDRLVKLAKMRDLLKQQLVLETQDAPASEMEGNRQKLAQAYRAFIAENGLINDPANAKLLRNMPDGALLLSLEHKYRPAMTAARAKKSGQKERPASAEPAAILSSRVIPKYEPATTAANPAEALLVSLAESGKVDMARIAGLLGVTEEEAAQKLQDGERPLVFFDPEEKRWETADAYLTGLVRRKLNAAREAGLPMNVTALERVQPELWGAENVTARIGAAWIPAEVYSEFVRHLTGAQGRVDYAPATNAFSVSADTSTIKAGDWQTQAMDVDSLLTSLLNSRSIKVTYRDSDGKSHVDQEATDLANLKAKEIAAEFEEWVFRDADRRGQLVAVFNDLFNTRVQRQHDGTHLTLPGKVPDAVIEMRRHQKNTIWRGISERFLLIDHVVGAGKTFTAVARAMERRRMGLSRKPMIVVPNHLVESWAAEVYRLYPGAKVLAAGKADFEKQRRRRVFAKIATGDWDIVIVPHSSFGFIGIAPETEARFLENELRIANQAIEDAWEQAREDGQDHGRRKPFTVKEAERLAEAFQARLDKVNTRKRDRLLTFEQLGVDDLTVDEAHEFKNLFYSSRMSGVRGMGDKSGSSKAFDLFNKVRVLRESPNGTVTFMTGTPISNSAVEMYTMMRYLAADQLRELGLEHFDAWRAQFVDATVKWEPTESGRLKEVNRLGRSWSNMRSLMDLYYSFTDAVAQSDISKWYAEDHQGADFPIPKVKGGDRQAIVVKPTVAQEAILADVLAGFDGLPQISDIMARNAQRLRLMDRARKVSLDARAVERTNPSTEPGGKLERVAAEVARIHKRWAGDRGTQLIFLDRSVPKSRGDDTLLKAYDKAVAAKDAALAQNDEEKYRSAVEALEKFDANEIAELRAAQAGGWNAYQQIKDNLVALGIPAKEIRFIQEANDDAQKKAMFDAVNDGEVRVLIGSTPRMGAGTNVQQRLVALHHVDVTWKPSDIEQREGRIIRQGNELREKYGSTFEVEILTYVTERTVDAKLWDVNSSKLRMINGIRKYTGEFNMDFPDEEAVGMAEIAALASGDPLLLERVKLTAEIDALERLRRAHSRKIHGIEDERRRAERDIRDLPAEIERIKEQAKTLAEAVEAVNAEARARRVTVEGQEFSSSLDATTFAYAEIKRQKGDDENAKYSLNIGGNQYTSKTAIDTAIAEALGDLAPFSITIEGEKYVTRGQAAKAILEPVNVLHKDAEKKARTQEVGRWFGLTLKATVSPAFSDGYSYLTLTLADSNGRTVASESSDSIKNDEEFKTSAVRGLLGKLQDDVERLSRRTPQSDIDRLARAKEELPVLQEREKQTWPQKDELARKQDRLEEVVRMLSGSGTPGAAVVAQDGAEQGGDASAAAIDTDSMRFIQWRQGAKVVDRFKDFTVPELDGIDLFLHKDEKGKEWIITERRTGLRVTSGDTQKEAKDGLQSLIARLTADVIKQKIAEAKSIPEDQKQAAAAEAMNAPRLSRSGSVSYEPVWSGDIEGAQVTQYEVTDFATDEVLGTVTVHEQDGKPVVMFDISANQPGRGQGPRMLRAVLERAQGDEVYLVNLQPKAQDWWRRVGATIEETDGGNPNGTIDLQRLEAALGEGRGAVQEGGGRAAEGPEGPEGGPEAPGQQGLALTQTPADAGVSASVARVAEELEARMGRPAEALGVKIVPNWKDLPNGRASFVESRGAYDVQGMFDPDTGETYLVAANIVPGRAFAVYLHELGVHKGLRDLLGPQRFTALASQIKTWSRGVGTEEEVRLAKIAAARIPEGTPTAVADEELIAYFVETAVNAGHDIPESRPQKGRLAQWLHDLWAAVRSAMEKLGAAPDTLTAAEVVTLARGAAERATKVAAIDQTESAAFKRWFQGSKVVDAQGRPLVVYHGTTADFREFSSDFIGDGNGGADWGEGFYFTDRADAASQYAKGDGGNVMPVYLVIRNPAPKRVVLKVMDAPGAQMDTDYVREELESRGYDGIIVTHEGGGREIVAFRPEQIKSAIGNRGTFDPNNQSILRSMAPRQPAAQSSQQIEERIKAMIAEEMRLSDEVDAAYEAGSENADALDAKLAVLRATIDDMTGQLESDLEASEIEEVGIEEDLAETWHDWKFQTFQGKGWDAKDVADRVRDILENNGTSLRSTEGVTDEQALAIAEDAWQARSDRGARIRAAKERPMQDPLLSRAGFRQVQQAVADVFRSDKTFNWWHRTVGTQYHKAQIDRDFGRVFRIGQDYLQDVNYYSAVAEEEAPDLLLRLETPGDLFLRHRISAKNARAIAGPIFEGTLNDTVWTDDELRQRYSLTDKQIDFYRQFRAATDRSLDEMAKSQLAKMARAIGIDRAGVESLRKRGLSLADFQQEIAGMIRLREQVLQTQANGMPAGSPERAQKEERVASLKKQRTATTKLYNRVAKLKRDGYAPLMRFGQYTVDVVDAAGDRQFFGMYETQFGANRAARQMATAFPGSTIETGTLSREKYRAFQGLTPETVDIFGRVTGLADDALFQEYLRLAVNNRSALTRLIHRKEIPGFSEDVTRVLASFITSNARLTAANFHAGDMLKATVEIPNRKGVVRDEAEKLRRHLTDPQEEGAMVRGWLFATFLGGSVAAALVNLTQPVMMTAPHLTQYANAARVAAEMAKASMEGATGRVGMDVRAAYDRAKEEGVVAPHEIYQLMAEARGRVVDRWAVTHRLARLWGGMFSLAEAFNRRVTFIAAYRIGVHNRMADPYRFAVKVVQETQGIYNKGNRPNWARGTVGATVFTFKQFSIAYLEWWKRLPPKQKLLVFVMLYVAAGLQGLPGVDDIEDLIDAMGQWLGYGTNSKKWLRQNAARILGEDGAQFVLHGISAGLPFDISARLGLGNLFPGTELLKRSNTDKGNDLAEVAGPLGSVVGKLVQGKPGEALLPKAYRDGKAAVDMWFTEEFRDGKGRLVLDDVTGTEAAIKGIGFNPSRMATAGRVTRENLQDINLVKATKTRILDDWTHALLERHQGKEEWQKKLREAQKDLKDWNTKNPEMQIRIEQKDIQRRMRELQTLREDRITKTAPKTIRKGVAEDLRK